MHEGGHGFHEGHDHGTTRYILHGAAFPIALLGMILVALVPGLEERIGFPPAIVPMLLGGGFSAYQTGLETWESRRITAGVLVVIALVGTAYVEEYLAGAIVALMMIGGEYLEGLTLEKTRRAVHELVRLTPERATVRRGDAWVTVPIAEVVPGDRILVRPGERVPVDGTILEGEGVFNEAAITGESMPVEKGPERPVFAGTINESGAVEIAAEKIGRDSTLGRIVQIVREAQERKGRTQRIADRFAGWFTPAILLICVGVWFATGDLMRVMAVLVIACPCALVLATPTAVVASVGNAARRGVLVKGGIVLEALGRVNALCFDKTGTLTKGAPEVVEIVPFGETDERELLAVAAMAESRSEHPIGRAITLAYTDRVLADDDGASGTVTILPVDSFRQVFGVGVVATREGEEVWVGNHRLLDRIEGGGNRDAAEAFCAEQEAKGRTSLVVLRDGVYLGGIAVADALREAAPEAVATLRRLGISRIAMVTGDHETTARAIAGQVDITEVYAGVLPDEKLDVVRRWQEEGLRVAMVGDGVNDAPALMLADVGIAMGAAGTDVAIESAGIALMGDDLLLLPRVLDLGRRTVGIIRQNIYVFAVGVNVVGVALASLGVLHPIGAAIVHNIASVFVVLNSARLLTYGNRPR